MRFSKFSLTAVAAIFALSLAVGTADARIGGGSSFGSRGTRTFTPPPVTQTAPKVGTPIQRSVTPQAAPRTTNPTGNTGGFFGRPGFLGGLFTGFLGAGLLGMLFGGGFFGGIGGFGSILGLVLQLALVALLARWLIGLWQRRNAPAVAANGPSYREGLFGYGGGNGGSGPAAAPRTSDFTVSAADLDFFEQRLGEVQDAYSREDLGALRKMLTTEMVYEINEQLTANASRGAVNHITDVKLLQGDVAEAWREGGDDYATLAMRYALKDVTVDRDSGKVVEEGPGEVTELWTFRRGAGGNWLLSAIQQA